MTDTDSRWEARLRLALADRGVGYKVADEVMEEVGQHCAASGESPEEAFGKPDEYAVAVVRDRIPDAVRAERRWDAMSFQDHVDGALILTGWWAMVAGLILWLTAGFMMPLTWGGLVGAVLVLLAAFTASLGYSFSGTRLPSGLAWIGGGLGLATAAALAFTLLPATELGRVPALLLSAVGAASFAWGFLREHDDKPHGAPGDRSGGAEAEDRPPLGREEWLRELPRLLKELHGLPSARAKEITEDVARHVRETGGEPEEEFGPVHRYALQVTDGEPAPLQRWWLRSGVSSAGLLLAVSLGGFVLHFSVLTASTWVLIGASLMLVLALVLFVVELAEHREEQAKK
ncbi:hypothetical protein [Streptomyces spiramenti]|uniref:DUF1707 domain-containing protein n=1 Tax=Streptomyces spiramenti TaxID=2720606 RepID=A0ABX1APZ9_9ACTN|nr:hypothetical protein [Streptomyces spiramenti]NJP66350.1 hypothetical protein [Streptomyces spiramenti]